MASWWTEMQKLIEALSFFLLLLIQRQCADTFMAINLRPHNDLASRDIVTKGKTGGPQRPGDSTQQTCDKQRRTHLISFILTTLHCLIPAEIF